MTSIADPRTPLTTSFVHTVTGPQIGLVAVPKWVPIPKAWATVFDTKLAAGLTTLTNKHRKTIGLHALTPAPVLRKGSRFHSASMAFFGYLDHYDQRLEDGQLVQWRDPASRFYAAGWPATRGFGENAAYAFLTAQSVFDAFMSDSGHRANIENPSWTVHAVAVAIRDGRMPFWTHDFGA